MQCRGKKFDVYFPHGFLSSSAASTASPKRLKRLFDFAGFGRGAFKLLRLERSIRFFYGMNFSLCSQ